MCEGGEGGHVSVGREGGWEGVKGWESVGEKGCLRMGKE